MKIIKKHQDFLEAEVEQQTLIMVNPPWNKLGVKFIEKSINLLKPGGDMVCIMDYNKFTRSSKTTPSLFNRMQNQGHFKFISTDVAWGNGYFKGVADSIQFVWEKNNNTIDDGFFDDPEIKTTTIKNRTQEIFDVELQGNEQYVPQMKNDSDFFDWNDGIQPTASPSSAIHKEDKLILFLRKEYKNCVIRVLPKGEKSNKGCCAFPLSGENKVDQKKLEDLISKHSEILYNSYVVSHGWPRLPPFKRELLQTNKTDKENNEST